MYLILILIVCSVAVNNGLGQSYNFNGHPYFMGGGSYRILGRSARQYRDYPFSPFSSPNGGITGQQSIGGLMKTSRSNYPSQFYDNQASQSIASMTSSSSPIQPSSFFSGFYYPQDKPSRGPQQSYPYIPHGFIPVPIPPHSSLSVMSPAHLQSVVVQQLPPVPAPSRYQYSRFLASPSSSPHQLKAATMDTYQEALNLFSEVVHKLEKETGSSTNSNSYARLPHTPQFTAQAPLITNGIYGSSIPNGGFPHHLDTIMGPDFIQRAQKLYAKIIKEQNDRLRTPTPAPIIPSQKYSMYHPGNRNSIHGNGNYPYYQTLLHSGPTLQTYSRPSSSYLARNMNIDPFVNSPFVDAVKSIEIPMGRRDDVGSGEMMETSESNQRPILSPMNVNMNQLTMASPLPSFPSTQTPPMSTASPAPSLIPLIEPQPQASLDNPEVTVSTAEQPKSLPIPISENDYIEHPLSYQEYEGLVRDIAVNHNY